MKQSHGQGSFMLKAAIQATNWIENWSILRLISNKLIITPHPIVPRIISSHHNHSFYAIAGSARGAIWSESCVLIGDPSGQYGPILPARDCPLWFRARKKLFGADTLSLTFLDNVDDRSAKSGRRQLKQRKHKRLLSVNFAIKPVGYLSLQTSIASSLP